MKDDIAIEVKDLHKDFVLPHEKANSVKSIFTSLGFLKKKKYEKQHALNGVSFTVKKGEFFGIVGRNGSGKSTLLKLLAGIYQPTKGSVKVNGKIVPFIELGVGFNPALSGRDNVYLNGAMLGFSDKEVDEKYEAIVEFAELERFMDQKLKNYSSGMQVRLAFSVATILAESDILLLDEVLAVGDADFQRKCFSYFKTLKKQDKTVIFITHDMSAIREYCDRSALIDNNKIKYIGKSDKVADMYLQLFSGQNISKESSDENAERWGDEGIKYDTVSVAQKNSQILISLTATSKNDYDSGNFGFTIRDETGQPIMGTNSQIKNKKIGPIKAGDKILIEWNIPNIFSEGNYAIDPAIVSDNHIDVHDWWTGAANFTVYNRETTPYKVSPKIELEHSVIH